MGSPETVAPLHLQTQRAANANRTPIVVFRRVCALIEAIMDGVACWVGTMGSFWLDHVVFKNDHFHHWTRDTVEVSALAAVLVVVILNRDHAYGSGGSLLQIRDTERAIRLSAQIVMLLLVFAFVLRLSVPASALAIDFLILPPLLISEKMLLGGIVKWLHVRGFGVEKVAVYGAGDAARRVVTTLLNSPRLGLHPVVVIDDAAQQHGGYLAEFGYRRLRAVPIRSVSLSSRVKCSLPKNWRASATLQKP